MSKPSNKFVIGLTGSIGSGCTTLSYALEENGFKRISISECIKKNLKRFIIKIQLSRSLDRIGVQNFKK